MEIFWIKIFKLLSQKQISKTKNVLILFLLLLKGGHLKFIIDMNEQIKNMAQRRQKERKIKEY